eukprot:Nk52_evm1s267 gene=Nk52_evmTU1s267
MNTINNIRSATTGFSPSQLALGRSTTLLDYDDGRHRNRGMPEEMPWMDYMSDQIRRIIYPMVCGRIEEKQNLRVDNQEGVRPVEYKKYNLVYVARKETLNPLTIREKSRQLTLVHIMKPERYGNTEDVHQYTVKYLIDGTVYSGVHYRRTLKVNPVSVPTFPSLTANLNGIDCGGLKIHSHRYYEGTGAEYQVYDPDDNTYQQWLSSHQVDPSLIVTYWEEYYADVQERGQNDMPD